MQRQTITTGDHLKRARQSNYLSEEVVGVGEEGRETIEKSGMRGRLKEKEWKIIMGYFLLTCYLPSVLGTSLASTKPAGCQRFRPPLVGANKVPDLATGAPHCTYT
jgi:hypothetical protein